MEDNKILKLVYTFVLGLFITVFVGVGIDTFYSSPKMPEFDDAYGVDESFDEKPPTPEEEKEWQSQAAEDEKKWREYGKKMEPYNRNVSIISLIIATLLIAVSIVFDKKLKFLADGIMLGGLFTLMYSIGRGLASNNKEYVFIALTFGLVLVLYLGYRRFVQPEKPKKTKK